MRPAPCHECPLSGDCTLESCTLAERQQALAATRQVREEQYRMLAARLEPQERVS